ncbi:MAG: tetratricopeptide repeat protein [Hyphomicrobiaceae bacterium]|nr:tetratricopeptide repeat protein [Hyphomicrobiaceae bacterium]
MAKSANTSDSSELQAMFEQAAAAHRQGDFEAAASQYAHLLTKIPDHPQILNMYGLACVELGDLSAAEQAIEKATKTNPRYVDAWLNLGVVRQRAGNLDAAADAYNQIRNLEPNSPTGHINYGNICQLLNRFENAVSAYAQALTITPHDSGVWNSISRAYLYAGNWEKALEATNRCLSLSPGNTGALAIRSAALLELGRTGEVNELVDFDRLIATVDLKPPPTFANLEAFNAALCAHCTSHPSLTFEPSENTTMKGHQTGNLSKDEDQGPVAHLLKMIDDAVRDYQRTHPLDPTHPFLSSQPTQWTYDIWATVLGSQGHQASHIHRSGWLSGCYYAKIPDVITAEPSSQDGWIEFGRPQDNEKASAEPIVRSYAPHEGMVVLFPSYFYHRTEPFESNETRISIAFDVIPAQ